MSNEINYTNRPNSLEIGTKIIIPGIESFEYDEDIYNVDDMPYYDTVFTITDIQKRSEGEWLIAVCCEEGDDWDGGEASLRISDYLKYRRECAKRD